MQNLMQILGNSVIDKFYSFFKLTSLTNINVLDTESVSYMLVPLSYYD